MNIFIFKLLMQNSKFCLFVGLDLSYYIDFCGAFFSSQVLSAVHNFMIIDYFPFIFTLLWKMFFLTY